MKTKTDLKLLFETNDTPREEDFSDWMDSYWHKEEKIPAASLDISNLNTTYESISTLKYGLQNPPTLAELTGIKRGDYYVQTSNGLSTGTEIQRALFNGVQLTEWTVTAAVWNTPLTPEQKNAVKTFNIIA